MEELSATTKLLFWCGLAIIVLIPVLIVLRGVRKQREQARQEGGVGIGSTNSRDFEKGARKSSPSSIGKSDKQQEAEPLPDGIVFRGVENTDGNRYEEHTGKNRDTALAFLREKEIKEERRYIIVETPDGNFGKDLVMIFDEKTSEMIEFGERKSLPQLEKSMTHCARCGYVVLPAGQSVAGATELIVMEDLKKGGIGFSCQKCRTLWCPFCISFIRGSKPFCGICGNAAEVFRE